MATITKSYADAISHQRVTNQQSVFGAAIDVSSALFATIIMHHGFIEAVPNTDAAFFKVQGSAASSGNENWVTLATYSVFDGTPATEALTATEAAAETSIAVASTTGFVAGDYVYITDATADTDDEWAHIDRIVTNTSIELVDGLTNGKASGDDFYSNAEAFVWQSEIGSLGRLRVIYSNEGSTAANTAIWARIITGDSIG